jgi:glutathione S-transferase
MDTLILHHYPASPFAEKIRRVLAFKQLAYRSVIIPDVMPKPDVLALTGGYRRTPILQIGADIYCDTALICQVLEQRSAEPALYPPHLLGVSRIVAQWADSTLFWAAMAYNLQPKGAVCAAAAGGRQGLCRRPGRHERWHAAPAPAGRHRRLPLLPAAHCPHGGGA